MNVIDDRIIFFEERIFIKVENDIVDRNVVAVNAIHKKFVSSSLC